MVQQCFVDYDQVGGIGEGGEPWGFSGREQLLGGPDIVWGGLGEEVGPVERFGSLYGFEIAEPGLPGVEESVGGLALFGYTGALCKLLVEGGEKWGPPGFGYGGGAGGERRGYDCGGEGGEGGGEP